MNIQFTKHARSRMEERGIAAERVRSTIEHADNRIPSQRSAGRYLAMKTFASMHDRRRICLVVYEYIEDGILVITVIDTSKVRKYHNLV